MLFTRSWRVYYLFGLKYIDQARRLQYHEIMSAMH